MPWRKSREGAPDASMGITGDRREASVTGMLEEFSWESLQERRLHQQLTMIAQIVGGRVAIPTEDHFIASSARTRSQMVSNSSRLVLSHTDLQILVLPRNHSRVERANALLNF